MTSCAALIVVGISTASTGRTTREPVAPPCDGTPTTVQFVPITVWQADGTGRRQMGTVTVTSLPDKPGVGTREMQAGALLPGESRR